MYVGVYVIIYKYMLVYIRYVGAIMIIGVNTNNIRVSNKW